VTSLKSIIQFQIKDERKRPDAGKIKERKWIGLNEMNARPHPGLLPRGEGTACVRWLIGE
ncbi:MAG: hypothetical protein ABSA45_12945, partial [Verrucomicrobiota bacterium]